VIVNPSGPVDVFSSMFWLAMEVIVGASFTELTVS
jgi:hypothetical protein